MSITATSCARSFRRGWNDLTGSRRIRDRRRAVLLAFACVVAVGCGETESSAPVQAVAGTATVFDLDADLDSPAQFFDFPYPSDVRLDSEGHPRVTGWPVPSGNPFIPSVKAIASQGTGFPATPAAYFRFTAPLAPRDPDEWFPAAPDAPVLLMDIDPDSPERLRLLPSVAATIPVDAYAPEHLLAVAGVPGIILHPHRTYAFVVLRSLGDATGAPLGAPLSFALLRAGQTPPGTLGVSAARAYAPLWPALDELGISRTQVAAATVFTTGDAVAEVARLTDSVLERYDVEIEDLALDPADGAAHERFCELHARVRFPQFQTGVPPYSEGGRFAIGTDGLPALQREEDAPVALAIPRVTMPAGGFPLVLYFHGTGGLATQVIDRGPVSETGGDPAPGLGPAHVLAAHGLASASSASPLGPERPPFMSGRTYLNLANLGAYPDTFRQGTIEQRLLLEALTRLRIDPALLAECDGVALPATASAFRFDTTRVSAMGQSLGGQYVNMVGAIEPRIAAVVPTGSGGHWSRVVLDGEIAPGIDNQAAIQLLLGTTQTLTYLHPGLQLVQLAFEPAEPIVFAPRLARHPLPGHPVRSLYLPLGIDDPGFPNWIYDAMALASGTQQAGEALAPGLQRSLALDGADGLSAYPVSDNRRSGDGTSYTGVAVQYADDGILDSHHILAQLDAVKSQYGCFFASAWATGTATVPPPGPTDGTCSE